VSSSLHDYCYYLHYYCSDQPIVLGLAGPFPKEELLGIVGVGCYDVMLMMMSNMTDGDVYFRRELLQKSFPSVVAVTESLLHSTLVSQ